MHFEEANREISDEVIAAQRQYVACSILGSAGQRFALQSNAYLQQELINRSMPFMQSDVIRQEVAASFESSSLGAAENMEWAPELTNVWLPMVQDEQSGLKWIDDNAYQVSIHVQWMMSDGTITHFEADVPEGMGEMERSLPNIWTFVKDVETGTWQMDSMRNTRDVLRARRM